MGTGLAIISGVTGYPFVAVKSKGNSDERAGMMRALGAEVVPVDQLPDSVSGQVSGGDLELVDREAQLIVAERGVFRADQFHRDGNWLEFYRTTGPEIWAASDGCIDGGVDFTGSAGTFAGVIKVLKERNSAIRCCVVEPVGAAPLAGQPVTRPEHPIQGGGNSVGDLPFLTGVYVGLSASRGVTKRCGSHANSRGRKGSSAVYR
ncbi:hypothetical protein LMG29660_04717 [Burkholderia puraquae]|uniref:Tryptophan synthase beta chain-like PALP domain-containing protein n=2 Tax=Burkholderia puraquae TaxID=1904757 RepID=A0A6J5ECG4_9BURK|nr:hypothetical protein LMG29660_04717 [Burkholderia puraquae]